MSKSFSLDWSDVVEHLKTLAYQVYDFGKTLIVTCGVIAACIYFFDNSAKHKAAKKSEPRVKVLCLYNRANPRGDFQFMVYGAGGEPYPGDVVVEDWKKTRFGPESGRKLIGTYLIDPSLWKGANDRERIKHAVAELMTTSFKVIDRRVLSRGPTRTFSRGSSGELVEVVAEPSPATDRSTVAP